MKNLTYLVLTLTLLTVSIDQATAQYVYPEQELCQVLKDRTLVVQLLDETDETAKNLNNALKEEFQSWKITPVVFKSGEEVEQLLDARDTQYAILTQDAAMQKDIRSRNVDQMGRLVIGPASGNCAFKQFYTAFSFSYYNFDLLLPTGKKRPEVVTSISFANGELSRIDYLYLVQQLSGLVHSSLEGIKSSDYYDPAAGVAQIKDSKLLFLEDLFKEKEVADIPKYYDAEYELVDMERYQDAILGKEAGVCYAKIIWSNQINMYEWAVVNAEDGKILAQQTFGGVKFGSTHDANDIIKVKHLKYVTNEKAQKFNNKY